MQLKVPKQKIFLGTTQNGIYKLGNLYILSYPKCWSLHGLSSAGFARAPSTRLSTAAVVELFSLSNQSLKPKISPRRNLSQKEMAT